jgi:dienelactone hydrolase
VLNEAQLATLLFDLLTPQEEAIDEHTRHLRFDVELLRSRLIGVVDWLLGHERTRNLRIGLFGASTGAAGALATAAARPSVIRAVVSRGGRPDLASSALPAVKAPTLLIVGELDSPVIALNRQAAKLLRGEHRLEVIPRASHLFTEPGALEKVAGLARDWFVEHLVNVWRE